MEKDEKTRDEIVNAEWEDLTPDEQRLQKLLNSNPDLSLKDAKVFLQMHL
jgi:hypothetical protein